MNIARYWLTSVVIVVVGFGSPELYAQHHIGFFGPVPSTLSGRRAAEHVAKRPASQTASTTKATTQPATKPRTVGGVVRASSEDPVPMPDEMLLQETEGSFDPSLGDSREMLPDGGVIYPLQGSWWVQGEYLMWWPRPMRVPALITSGTSTSQGVLNQDGTQTLLGGQMLDTMYSGGRFRAGVWTNPCAGRGWEFEFFGIGEETERQTYSGTGAAGTDVIARPFFNVLTTTEAPNGREDAELVAYPGELSGSVTVEATSRLYGIAVHPLWTNCQTCGGTPLLATNDCAPSSDQYDDFHWLALPEPRRATWDQ